MADRTTLLKFVLASIPLHCLSCIHIPVAIIKRIKKEHRAFLWDHIVDSRGFHLLSQDKICMPQNSGSLNIIPLQAKQQAFLIRLAANLVLNPNFLWTRVVMAKYQFTGSWHSYHCPCQSLIIQRKILRQGNTAQNHIAWAIGEVSLFMS